MVLYYSPMSMSSKKWLSRNGLNALKLTILDALAPTLIPHEPTYVPILNKHVLSKVFDDVRHPSYRLINKDICILAFSVYNVSQFLDYSQNIVLSKVHPTFIDISPRY